MNRRYLSIDSKYRNRKIFPLISQFEVPISQSGMKDSKNAEDPVCDSSPVVVFDGSFNKNDDSFIEGTLLLDGIGKNSKTNSMYVKCTINSLRSSTDFYRGSVIEFTNTIYNTRRVISSYEYVGNIDGVDVALISLDGGISDTFFNPVTTWKVYNVTNTALENHPKIFVPVGERITNIYKNYFIVNESLGQHSRISQYDGETCVATLESKQETWTSSHYYSIRKTLPSHTDTIQNVFNPTHIQLGPTSPDNMNMFVGSFLRIKGPLPSSPDTPSGPYGEMRRIIKYGTYQSSDGTEEYNKVVAIEKPFSTLPSTTNTYEILPFSRDNVVPFVFTGSHVSHQEMVTYEIELSRLILPNVPLESGDRLANFPYVWVELANVSSTGGGNKNIMYSNNPSSSKMLFKAPIFDTSYSVNSKFIKIDGDNVIQTVKFKINDNLRFSVRLPDGRPFTPEQSDTQSPHPPNPLLNISAMFALRRVV